MSFGYFFSEEIFSRTDEEILSCFYKPEDITAFEVQLHSWETPPTQGSYWVFVQPHRVTRDYLCTGDCMQAVGFDRPAAEDLAEAMRDRLDKIRPTTIETEIIEP